jgi:hypothetical protein
MELVVSEYFTAAADALLMVVKKVPRIVEECSSAVEL